MKSLRLALAVVITIFISGCTAALVKYQFSKAEEVSATSQARWITIGWSSDSNPVFYDPYQMYWYGPKTFSVPIRYSTRGEYGNWVYKMNCGSNQIEIISTLGGKQLNKTIYPESNNLLVEARTKLCGIQIGSNYYVFVGVDNKSLDYYYDAKSLSKNTKVPTRYKLTLLSFSKTEKKFIGKGEVEIDCADRTYKPANTAQWTSTSIGSPANVLTDQLCRTPYLSNMVSGRTYSDHSSNASNTNAQDYINKLNGTPKPQAGNDQRGSKSTKQPAEFDWKGLVIQPKHD